MQLLVSMSSTLTWPHGSKGFGGVRRRWYRSRCRRVARLFCGRVPVRRRLRGRPVPLETFLAVLPNRVRAAAAAGVGRAVLRSAFSSALDEYWVLLRTAWAAPRSDGDELAMASSFLLHRSDSGMRATVYLNHEGLPRSLGA